MKAFQGAHVAEFRIHVRPFCIEQPKQIQSSGLIRRSADIRDFDGLFSQRLECLGVLFVAG
jgi:hypothetical protein